MNLFLFWKQYVFKDFLDLGIPHDSRNSPFLNALSARHWARQHRILHPLDGEEHRSRPEIPGISNGKSMEIQDFMGCQMAVCQNLVPLVNIKIAGKWMFIPLKMVLIGIDPYPNGNISYYFMISNRTISEATKFWPWQLRRKSLLTSSCARLIAPAPHPRHWTSTCVFTLW